MACSRPRPFAWSVVLIALLVSGSAAMTVAAQGAGEPIKLSAVLTAFLVDSGVRTRGLPWTTGSELPVQWESPGPVQNPDQWAAKQGRVVARNGSFTGTIGDSVALAMTINVSGIPAGLAQVAITIPSMEVTKPDGSGFFATREMVEAALKNEGLQLQPVKCKRETEGASFGNLVDALKAPGKTASGLAWHWEAPQQQLYVTLTILYRRADLAQVECAGS
ncbi:MAG: hypothetical protein AB7R55_24235 [Gemmatimonadales bacterium]